MEIFDTHIVSFKTMEAMLLEIDKQVEVNVEDGVIPLVNIKTILFN